jgi:hypothetical protein
MSLGDTKGSASIYGEKRFVVKLNPSKVLTIDAKKDFYNFGKEKATPLERGKLLREFAEHAGFDVIYLKNVPGVGDEYAVINEKVFNKAETNNGTVEKLGGEVNHEKLPRPPKSAYENAKSEAEQIESSLPRLRERIKANPAAEIFKEQEEVALSRLEKFKKIIDRYENTPDSMEARLDSALRSLTLANIRMSNIAAARRRS